MINNKSEAPFKPGQSIAQFLLGPHLNFIYLILDWSSKKAALVDLRPELTGVFSQLKKHGFTIDKVLFTHSHFDHTAGLDLILDNYPQVPIYLHPEENFRLKDIQSQHSQRFVPISEGSQISLGSLNINVIHTPGHSAGACCFLINAEEDYLLTGDTIFIGTCGRCDLETGDIEQMFHSIDKLKKLPNNTYIFPGHQYSPLYSTTLSQELEQSPAFLAKDVNALKHIP